MPTQVHHLDRSAAKINNIAILQPDDLMKMIQLIHILWIGVRLWTLRNLPCLHVIHAMNTVIHCFSIVFVNVHLFKFKGMKHVISVWMGDRKLNRKPGYPLDDFIHMRMGHCCINEKRFLFAFNEICRGHKPIIKPIEPRTDECYPDHLLAVLFKQPVPRLGGLHDPFCQLFCS